MRVTFLGTGTSHGVPMIGCECPVCTSNDPRNSRTRCSVYVEVDGVRLLIDTAPELRIQAVREKIKDVNAVLFTHCHADHLFGLDDVRRFNQLSGRPLPCYGNAETLSTIRQAFDYVFKPTQIGGGKPSLDLCEIDGAFDVQGVNITPIPILHGMLDILGYRIGDFAYITDCSHIPKSSECLLENLDTLVLGVLRHEPHETHFSVSQGLAVIERLEPGRTFFTHIAHKLDHNTTNRALPPNVQLAHDGLKINI